MKAGFTNSHFPKVLRTSIISEREALAFYFCGNMSIKAEDDILDVSSDLDFYRVTLSDSNSEVIVSFKLPWTIILWYVM
jgi:hypothetical protein